MWAKLVGPEAIWAVRAGETGGCAGLDGPLRHGMEQEEHFVSGFALFPEETKY